MKFIDSNNDEEELEMLAERSPQMKKAVGVLKELSADERTRMLAEAREKARKDAASRLNWAREEGKEEGIQIGKEEGIQIGKEEGIQIGRKEGQEKIIDLLKSGKSPEEIIREFL